MADTPLISLVIPTRNSAALLPGALASIAAQTFRKFEVVISDGASTDATLTAAEQHASALPALTIESRPDSGVYDAINRGVRRTRGHWFLVLGSDDRLHAPDTLAIAAQHLNAAGEARTVYGDVRMMAVNKDGVAPGGRFAGPVPLKRLFVTNVCQQSVFYRRDLFDALGGFDLRFRLYADWDFNLRAAFHAPTCWIDLIVADYAATGMSATQVDAVFLDQLPHQIRRELEARADDPATWPLQDHLLRCANRFRRRGRGREAFDFTGAYLALLARRLPVRLGLRPP